MKVRGFTLIELLLVITLLSVVGAVMFPISVRFFEVQAVADTSAELKDILRTAQNLSLTQKNDTAHGIKLLDDSFVLFQGNTYDERVTDQDFIVPFSSSVTVSGLDEIVFAQGTGRPTEAQVIEVSLQEQTEQINVNSAGVIE